MPKGQWTPPDAGKDAPQEIKDILQAVYSDYRDQHPAEDPEVKATASQIAWGAVHNAGWEQDADGKWVKKKRENSAPGASFDPAAPVSKGVSDSILHVRALAVEFAKPKIYELQNGDLLIKDAPLLAEGEWTDSAQKTPLYYTAKALQDFAGNWKAKTGWNRHLKGQPRDKTNEVAEAVDPHYGQFTSDDGTAHNAILSDIVVYGGTPNGRAMEEMIKRKMIKFLSVEHGGDEEYNPVTKRTESKTLEFYGFAFVPKGACKVCRFNEAPAVEEGADEQEGETPMITKSDSFEGWQDLLRAKLTAFLGITYQDGSPRSVWPILTFPDRVVYSVDDKYYEAAFTANPDGTISFNAPVEVEQAYIEKKALEAFPGVNPKELMALVLKNNNEDNMDAKELEAAVTAATAPLMKELADLKASQKSAEVKIEIPKELSELPAQVKELAAIPAALKSISDRLDALEKTGTAKSVAEGDNKSLEALPEYFVPVDRVKGTIGGDE